MVVWCVRHSNVLTTAWNITELRAVDRSHHHISARRHCMQWLVPSLHFLTGWRWSQEWSVVTILCGECAGRWVAVQCVSVCVLGTEAGRWLRGWCVVGSRGTRGHAVPAQPARWDTPAPAQPPTQQCSAPWETPPQEDDTFSCSRSSGFFTKVYRASIHLL